MSNTLRISLIVEYTHASGGHMKKEIHIDSPFAELEVQAAQNFQHTVDSLGLVTFSTVTNGGWAFVKNHDVATIVEIKPDTGDQQVVEVNPGEFAAFRLTADDVADSITTTSGTAVTEWWIFPP